MNFPSAFLSLEQFSNNRADMEAFFSNPALAEGFPEAQEELAAVVSLESHIANLVNFEQRLRSTRGMSRGMAMELKELVPDLQSYSPNNYTNDPSGIMYQVSLEDISVAVWAAIAAAVGIVLAMIYKFINWITGGSSSGGGGGGGGSSAITTGINENSANVKVQAKVIHTVHQGFNSAPKTVHVATIPLNQSHEAVKNSHMPPALKAEIIAKTKDTQGHVSPNQDTTQIEVEIMKELGEIQKKTFDGAGAINKNSLVNIFFNKDTQYLDAVVDSFDIFDKVAEEVIKKADLLKTAMEAGDDTEDDIQEAYDIATAKSNVFEGGRIKMIGRDIADPRQWESAIYTTFTIGKEVAAPDNILEMLSLFDTGYEKVANVDWGKLQKLAEAITKAEKVLEQTQKELTEKARSKVEAGKGSARSMFIRTVTGMLQNDLNSLMQVYSKLTAFYRELSIGGHDMLVHFKKALTQFVTFFHKYEQPVPAELTQQLENMEDHLKTWKDHPVHARFLSERTYLDYKKG